MPATKNVVQVTMQRDKETKNTFRFTSPMEGDVQGSVYVKKSNPLSQQESITISVVL